jgi:hypothetical protein
MIDALRDVMEACLDVLEDLPLYVPLPVGVALLYLLVAGLVAGLQRLLG